jgi:hypothetical protein
MTYGENPGNSFWSVEIGFYPGILLGYRVYEYEDALVHVLYLPFVDISLEISKD